MAGANPTQDVEQAVAKAQASVSQSMQSLNTVLSTTSQSVDPQHVLGDLETGLFDGFRSLLSSLRHATTALSLAFKPPITPDAAVQQLEKLERTFGQCGTCVLAATGKTEGGKNSLLVEEWKEGVLEIGQAIQRYLAVLEGSAKTGAGPSGTSGSCTSDDTNGAYLVQTGAVWESIDRALGATPATELDALRKRWEGQRGVMKDAWEEFKEFLDEAAEESDGEDDSGSDGPEGLDEEDDEWAELERGLSGGKMTPEERERAERLKTALALHQVLHSSLPRFFGDLRQSAYRPLLNASSAQVAAFDTAIASLYPEQHPDAVIEAFSNLHSASKQLGDAFRENIIAGTPLAGTFMTRWMLKAEEEKERWSSDGLSVASLAKALP